MRPRIRTQAILVSALPLIFLLLVFGLALLIQQTILRGASFEQRTQRVLVQADRLGTMLSDANRAALSYTEKRDPAMLRRIDAVAHRMPAEIAALEDLTSVDPAMHARAHRIGILFRRGMDIVRGYAQALAAGHVGAARAIGDAPSTRALATQLTAEQTGFNNAERTSELARLNGLRAVVFRYEYALIFTSVAGILLTIMVSGRFGIGIAERLKRLAENAERLASGKPARALEGSDEFADLDKVYQAMMLRIAREHHIAATLQHAMLPQRLPKLEGVRIDSSYAPAAHDTDVGGDWYDVFALSETTLCISVGDVAGHGLRAATLMAGARLAVRTAARIDPSPAQILKNVNRVLCSDEPDTLVTAFVGVLDLATGMLTYSLAGHPPPLVISPDGETHFLEGRGFMLGAESRAAFDLLETTIGEGWALLVYTDGVIEVEREYFNGLNRLVEAARTEYNEPSDNIAEAIQRRVMQNAGSHDDAALLFIGVTKLGAIPLAPARRTWSLDAREESSSRRVKRALMWHLGELVEPNSDLSAVELILGELIGNVARHTPGPAEVALEYGDGAVVLRVSDRGRPFEPSTSAGTDLFAESGRGLFLVQLMAHDLRIDRSATGNHVTAVLPVALA